MLNFNHMSTNILKNRKFYLIAGVAILIVLLILFFSQRSSAAVSCADSTCLIAYANGCENVEFADYSSDGVLIDYSAMDCTLTKKIVIVPDSEPAEIKLNVEGKQMTCKYNKGSFNQNWTETLYGGLDGCEGPLKDVLLELSDFYLERSSSATNPTAPLPSPQQRSTFTYLWLILFGLLAITGAASYPIIKKRNRVKQVDKLLIKTRTALASGDRVGAIENYKFLANYLETNKRKISEKDLARLQEDGLKLYNDLLKMQNNTLPVQS